MIKRRWRMVLLGLALLSTPACMQKMADQPAPRPLEPSEFFPDGRSARPLPEGVMARSWLLDSNPLMTGLSANALSRLRAIGYRDDDEAATADKGELAEASPAAPSDVENYVNTFPFPISEQDLRRGQERYSVFCAVCHGPLGDGKGKIWERGYLVPTSFLSGTSRGFDKFLKQVPMNPYRAGDQASAPVGYYFEVVSKGYGGMPSYAAQIEPADRWRIIAYIRALQYSASAELGDLPEDVQEAAREALGVQE